VARSRTPPADVPVAGVPAQAVIVAAPAVRARPPGRFGDVATADIEVIAELAARVWLGPPAVRAHRRSGTRMLLERLVAEPGRTWTERWTAAGLDGAGRPVADLEGPAGVGRAGRRERIACGFRILLCLRVLQPSLVALRSNRVVGLAESFRVAEADPLLDRYFDALTGCGRSITLRARASFDIACVLITSGVALADLTPEALLHYALESSRHQVTIGGRNQPGRHAGRLAWDVLHQIGHFPSGTPHTLQACLNRGQLTAAQLVDRHGVRQPQVRQLLVDYLERRRPETDYSSWFGLSLRLAGHFWAAIERINPDQADLALPGHVYDQWRAGLNIRNDGRRRLEPEAILTAVRAFYLDLHSWAIDEPDRWAQWTAPCPIPASTLRGSGARRRRVSERVAGRIRQRQPLLPALVEHATQRHRELTALLAAAAAAPPGARFTHAGCEYQRTDSAHDQQASRAGHELVRVIDQHTGTTRNLTLDEDNAFWAWACIETMRHSGVRVEELVELSQLSLRRYLRPNGETIALLVIAPSKTDRERVIPMSAELLHVVAAVVRRHTTGGRSVPVIRRYDPHERQWSAPMPFLFQRRGAGPRVLSFAAIREMLQRTCAELAHSNPAFEDVAFTPHDFRRLLATDLVNSGLPIHVGAKLLGHLNIQTTQSYVAVFEEDMVRHYQDFLARRRALRPADEYRAPTDDEWDEFQEHFDKRKVELGSCARPYGTPCRHEHACIRCPMLQINPAMLPRLEAIDVDLQRRRDRALAEGWLGEIEGIDLTRHLLREKQDAARRRQTTNPRHDRLTANGESDVDHGRSAPQLGTV
jgi:site-specific recombinase XerD